MLVFTCVSLHIVIIELAAEQMIQTVTVKPVTHALAILVCNSQIRDQINSTS